MKKMNNKGFLLVETIIVATFTLTVLVALFIQFKSLLASYNNSYNYNTVEGVYNLNAVKTYLTQYQNSNNSLTKQLKSSSKPYLMIYKGNCEPALDLGVSGGGYCDNLMTAINVKQIIFLDSNPTKIKTYITQSSDSNITEEMRNVIKKLDKIDNQNRLIAEYNDGTMATIVFGVNSNV